jgi:hypothetical protein
LFLRFVPLCLLVSVALSPLLGCGPRGLALRAPLRPLPSLPLVLVRNQEGLKPAGYYMFNHIQWRQLDRVRCRFDPRSKTAARLYRRGFSSAEVVQACLDLRRYAKGAPHKLEAIAAYRRSGLPLASFGKYLASGRSLTDYYNQARIGGRGLATAGWILTGIGAAALLGCGVAFLGVEMASWRCPDSYESDCGEGYALGAWVVSLGLMGVDTFRLRYLNQARRTPVRLSLAPLVSRGGGGLSFRLQW